MKNILLAGLLLAASPIISYAQAPNTSTTIQGTTRIYTEEEVDQAPIFTKKASKPGFSALGQFTAERFRIPANAFRARVHGETLCSFVVDAQGNISDLKIIKSIHPEVDAEALRVIRLTKGHWKPGMKNNAAVVTLMTCPFRIATH